MKTTIDRAGRIVIPRTVRDALGLRGGETVDVIERDGRIEIELPPTEMGLERRGRGLVAVSDEPLPTLPQEAVRETLERLRR
jgi:AbrB family looped-hinge helix DNA binding protein